MGVMDFLMGKPSSVESDPRTKAARDFILDELMRIYGQGPINVPKYIAEVPEQRYSGTNSLLSALGLDTVAPPQMDTVNIGGINAYSSEPYQEQIEADFAEKYPSLYNQLINRTPTNNMTASLVPQQSGGGGGSDDSPTSIPVLTGTNYAANADPNNSLGLVNKDGTPQTFDILGYGQNDNKDVVALGYGAGMVDPSLAKAAGYDYRDDNPYDYSFSDHMSAMAGDVGNIAKKVATDVKNTSLIGRIFGGGR